MARASLLATARPLWASIARSTASLQRTTAGDGDTVNLTMVEPSGAEMKLKAKIGTSLLDLARENDVELEGACEGTLACSTCHCIMEQPLFDQLPPPEEEELDMLDLAAALTDTSRLGCQVIVTKAFEGARIVIPDEFNDLQGDPIDESK